MSVDKKILARTKRRLERAELALLREHVVELAEKLEAAERRAQIAEDREHNAHIVSDMWQDIARERESGNGALTGTPAPLIGMTRDGQIGTVAP